MRLSSFQEGMQECFEILHNGKYKRIRICCVFCNLAYIIFSFASNSESFNTYLISLSLVIQPVKTKMFKLYQKQR